MNADSVHPWLLLIHRIPPKPAYFRAKILRRLQGLGAVAIKNSVYVLPKNDQTNEDFQWVLREIIQGGGEGSLCEAQFVEGLTDLQVQTLFNDARDTDYEQVAQEARALLESYSGSASDVADSSESKNRISRLRKKYVEISAIDFFDAPGREVVESLLSDLENRLKISRTSPEDKEAIQEKVASLGTLQNRTWVTREDIYVDRIASAWLISQFIDQKARFKFVSSESYSPAPDEIRFDMFEAELTHEGDRCTFEVLLKYTGMEDPALRQIAEIIHDIDLKDSKFRREEAFGLARLLDGISIAHKDDEERLQRGGAIFDDLYAYFAEKRSELLMAGNKN